MTSQARSAMTRRSALQGLAAACAAGLASGGASHLASGPALAQGSSGTPRVKLDVPYVPTPQDVVDRMLEIARVRSDDFVMDLGCGDGRILVTAAARYGARGYGVDINPARIAEAVENARKAGVSERVTFEIKDLFKTPIEQASVLALYLLPTVMLTLRPKILADMKPGSRIVSHDFHMDDWEPDFQESMADHDIFHWVVPARAEGFWTVTADGESYSLFLRQKFQRIDGRLSSGRSTGLIREGRVTGERLRFTAVFDDGRALVFNGRIAGDRLIADASPAPVVVKEWGAARAQ